MALIPYADDGEPEDERVRAIIERLPEPRINIFTMLANAPALAGPALRLGEAILTKSDLDPGLRELVILHTARLTDTEYEWVQHEAIARLIGVSEEKIASIDRGDLDALAPDEGLALRLVSQLLSGNGTPEAELIQKGEAELGRSVLVEVLLVAGYYAMLGGVMRAVRIDVDHVLEKGMLDSQRLSGRDRAD